METEEILQTLREVIFKVFETMFFLFPEVIENQEDVTDMPRDYFKARIHLNDNKWLLILLGSEKLAEAMTKNFLGQEGSVDEFQVADVFREAVNVIAGNFLMKLGGKKRISLGIPEVEKCRRFSRDETKKNFFGGALFNVDNEFCEVLIKGIDT
jgi:hypothetical protein